MVDIGTGLNAFSLPRLKSKLNSKQCHEHQNFNHE